MTWAKTAFAWLLGVFAVIGPAHAQLFSADPLLSALRDGGATEVNAALMAGASVHKRDSAGTPAIVLAAQRRDAEIVSLLLKNGARPNDHASDGDTALTIAAANGDLEIVRLVLDANADINKPGALRETALIRAVRANFTPVVKLLIERKANLDDTDSSGATALSVAEGLRDKTIAGLLRQAGAK